MCISIILLLITREAEAESEAEHTKAFMKEDVEGFMKVLHSEQTNRTWAGYCSFTLGGRKMAEPCFQLSLW